MFTTSDAHEHLLITTTRLNFTQVFLVFEFSGDNDSSTLTSLEDLGSILLLKVMFLLRVVRGKPGTLACNFTDFAKSWTMFNYCSKYTQVYNTT